MNFHINDFQHGYIEYMHLEVAHSKKEGKLLPLNTCQAVMTKNNQKTVTKGVLCTDEAELHIQVLTCAREI